MRSNEEPILGGLAAVAVVNRGGNVETCSGVWEPTVRMDFYPIGSWALGDMVLAP